MEEKQRFKKIFAVFCLIIIINAYTTEGNAACIYAVEEEGLSFLRRPCPRYEMEELLTDDIQVKIANALRAWFISEYAFEEDWYDILSANQAVILLEPYIIQKEYGEAESDLTVYCLASISSFARFEGETGQQYLAQGYDTTSLFRVSFEIYDSSDWRTISVYRLSGEGEELYTGAGIGTDGFPGLTDEFEREIPDWGFDTEHIAQKYLEQCQIDAQVVMW